MRDFSGLMSRDHRERWIDRLFDEAGKVPSPTRLSDQLRLLSESP